MYMSHAGDADERGVPTPGLRPMRAADGAGARMAGAVYCVAELGADDLDLG